MDTSFPVHMDGVGVAEVRATVSVYDVTIQVTVVNQENGFIHTGPGSEMKKSFWPIVHVLRGQKTALKTARREYRQQIAMRSLCIYLLNPKGFKSYRLPEVAHLSLPGLFCPHSGVGRSRHRLPLQGGVCVDLSWRTFPGLLLSVQALFRSRLGKSPSPPTLGTRSVASWPRHVLVTRTLPCGCSTWPWAALLS